MKRLFGGLLLAAGILIMLVSGLCTLVVSVLGLSVVAIDPSVILLPVMFGGIPFCIGFGLYKWGRSLLREPGNHDVF